MEAAGPGIDREIGERVRALRAARSLTLDDLAARSGVSRAMLSRIERGESSPTAQLLNRVCNGLGVTLSRLFEQAERGANPVSRRADQVAWRDPASGYVRRAVSPPGVGSHADIVAVDFPPGAAVTFAPQDYPDADQQIFVLDGAMELTVGATRHLLEAGDCLHMRFGAPIAYRNPGSVPARYLVVIARGVPLP